MPLSGVFFVSLHHQSNRMTMFKKTDPNPQLDIFTAPSMQLGSRASKKYSDPNSWHNQFYSLVTTKIDEEIFKPLFPEGKKSGRPNASIRILVAMSVLKEGFGCSDEDLFEKCEFDLLTRKALGMELLTDVTPSIDTYYLCLFLNKVDTLKSTIMKKKEEQLQISLDRVKLQKHVYELCRVQKLTINEVRKKTGLGMGTIYRYLHTFEEENPKLVEQMKKQGPNIIPEDYKKLQEEVLRLKCELKRERLRADFYEEMVAFGKEVYGIDLKKAGTK